MEEGASFCSECGAKVDAAQEETAAPVAAPVAETEAKPEKKSKKGLIIGIIVGAVALIAAAVAVILFATGVFGGSKGEKAEAGSGKNTADVFYCKDDTLMLLKAGEDEAEELGACEDFDDVYSLSTYYYEKENKLFYIEGYWGESTALCCYDLEDGSGYPEEIISGVEEYFVTEDETELIYHTSYNELGKYVLADGESTVLERDVEKIYLQNGDIYYTTTGNDLYLLNEDGENEYIISEFGHFVMFKDKNDFMFVASYDSFDGERKVTLIASHGSVYSFDGERKEAVVKSFYDSSFIALDSENYAYYEDGELHAVIDGKKSSVSASSVARIEFSEDKKTIAYIEDDEYDEYGSYGTLYTVSIKGGKLGDSKLICEDVYKYGVYFEEDNELAYRKRNDDYTYSLCYGDVEVEYDGSGSAYVLKGTPDNFIYYYYIYEDYDGEMALCEYEDGETTVIAEHVDGVRRFGDKILYIEGCDSDGEDGTLYIYDGKKSKKLDTGVCKEIFSASGSGLRIAN